MLNGNARGKKLSLLPLGLSDQLPPEALHEAAVLDKIVATFASMGYERVEPPLVEFEENLLTGAGAAMASHTFRLMDPVSQQMMGVRADMTPQVARIAATRLKNAPRPLRLSYAGQVLRVKGSQLRPERQFAQAGTELIGVDSAAADAEVITLAVQSLKKVGVEDVSVDISLPTIVSTIETELNLDRATKEILRQALDRKDVAEVRALPSEAARIFADLMQSSGLAHKALEKLSALNLPAKAKGEVQRLKDVLLILEQTLPNVMLTVDPVEHRGFEYQTGLSFTLFAKNIRGELGRGGRYQAVGDAADLDEDAAPTTEPATGFSLYMDSVLRAAPRVNGLKRIFVPTGTAFAAAEALRENGWATVANLADRTDGDDLGVAKLLNCTHIWQNNEIIEVVD